MAQNSTLDYDAYLYGDSHEGLEERPPIADAEPLDDPLNIDPDTRVRYFRNNIYPYAYRMNYQDYYRAKLPIQVELVRLQNWMKDTGERLIILFEGRDAAGKGGAIRRFMEHWNPRGARVVALDKPSGAEVGQWYFQRYIRHFPAAGEIVLFDRSWYNRAGVERVFGFSTEAEFRVCHYPGPEAVVVDGDVSGPVATDLDPGCVQYLAAQVSGFVEVGHGASRLLYPVAVTSGSAPPTGLEPAT